MFEIFYIISCCSNYIALEIYIFVLNHDVVLKAYCSSWSLLFGIFITSWTYSVKFGQNISI